ncbi:MAG: BMP family ABC transporter substrate-binding protein, partial [Mesorhizobium sp.]
GATEIIQNMTGDTPAAWNDPAKGGEIAKTQIDQGADVVYAAAGGTGVGVLQAAADAGKLGIGVDSNQNGLKEGGVDYAMDDNNKALVTDEMKAAVEKAKADIIAGKVQVHDYTTDNNCPY